MIDYNILITLAKASRGIYEAIERMPPDARKLYEECAHALRIELVLLASATEEADLKEHMDNIAHLKSTLTSLDAIADIKLYRTTVKVLLKLAKTAATMALTL